MDLTAAIQYAGQAARPGTPAHTSVQSGLQSILQTDDEFAITNPVSSARDGLSPDLTRVLLCHLPARSVCLKLYPASLQGRKELEKHAGLLSKLQPHLPVPAVIGVYHSSSPFGFSALVTSVNGRPLDHELSQHGEVARTAIVASAARALATLHHLPAEALGVDPSYEPGAVVRTWQWDAGWYLKHADSAGDAAKLIRKAAAVLAGYTQAPVKACVLHRDLTPYNLLAEGGQFTAIVDWDHVGFSPLQEDVGKALIGLLGMLSIPRPSRLRLARAFLDAYAQAAALPAEELYQQSVPFALDTILDWIIGDKNAPREELAWAVEATARQDQRGMGCVDRRRTRPD
jgi:Ser/Thr protein kinase RdoA (MazF antagonist)